MARILGFTTATPGHLFQFIPVLLELRARGHDARLCICAYTPGPAQYGGIPVRTIPWNPYGPGAEGPTPGLVDGQAATWTSQAVNGEPIAEILHRLIGEESPDLLLIDPMLWGAAVVAEASRLPWANLAHSPLTIRALANDSRGPGLPPPRNPWDRVRGWMYGAALGSVESRSLDQVNRLRAAWGLEPLGSYLERYHTAPLTIATTAEPFEYPRSDWPASLRFVGPIMWEPPQAPPAWLNELGERPLVIVAGSSIPESGAARSWVRVALEALSEEAVQVVATLPTDEIPPRLPPNARAERFLAHGPLLARASCVVCHGGAGITQKALAAGVPVVAVPFAYDRFEVARRVEVAMAGVMLSGRRLTPERLRVAVRTSMARRSGAEHVAAAFRAAGGAPAAVDALDQLLRTHAAKAECNVRSVAG